MKVLSGGQTGVDRAAWDAALAVGLEQDGWVPKGRLAEDGTISNKYRCREISTPSFPERNKKNVQEGDITLVIGFGIPGGGTSLTLELCRSLKKPNLWIDLDRHSNLKAVELALGFIHKHQPQKLNIAGPRASYRSDIYPKAYFFLHQLLGKFSMRITDHL